MRRGPVEPKYSNFSYDEPASIALNNRCLFLLFVSILANRLAKSLQSGRVETQNID